MKCADAKAGWRLYQVLIPILCALNWSAWANDAEIAAAGAERFAASCAVCHGANARGDGPYATMLKSAPPDLTALAQNNGGRFPFNRVYNRIDGRDMALAHGTSDMPVWGSEWNRASSTGSRTELRGRILEMIMYLRSVQR